MKRIIFALVFALISMHVSAQETKKDSINTANLIKLDLSKEKQKDSIIKSGKKYFIHTGSRGGRYIIRVSRNTGNEYKQYLKKDEL